MAPEFWQSADGFQVKAGSRKGGSAGGVGKGGTSKGVPPASGVPGGGLVGWSDPSTMALPGVPPDPRHFDSALCRRICPVCTKPNYMGNALCFFCTKAGRSVTLKDAVVRTPVVSDSARPKWAGGTGAAGGKGHAKTTSPTKGGDKGGADPGGKSKGVGGGKGLGKAVHPSGKGVAEDPPTRRRWDRERPPSQERQQPPLS